MLEQLFHLKSKRIVPLCILSLVLLTICVGFANKTNSSSQYDDSMFEEAEKDSIINMSYDMEDIIESIFTNQGYKLPKDVNLTNGSDKRALLNFDEDIIYAYISPLSCWSCVKSKKKHLTSIDNDNIIFIIPNKFSNDIQTFLDYIGIPHNQIYFISKDLGLPIEETNKVFLFTINRNNTITNVFPPTKYSQEITEAYINSILNI